MATSRSLLVFVVATASGMLTLGCGDALDFGDRQRVEGSGVLMTESRSIGDFDRVVLAGEGQVLLAAGSEDIIEIETDANLISHIETEIAGNTLTISTERGTDIEPTEGVVYRLGCPRLTGAVLSGAGTIDLGGCVSAEGVDLKLSGAGTIRALDIDVSHLSTSLSGAGSVVVDGGADRLDLAVSGAGSFEAADLEVGDATVDSTGVGSIELWITHRLDVQVSGVGEVSYYGDPELDQTVSGVGSVVWLGSR